jgi:hypothetical protein
MLRIGKEFDLWEEANRFFDEYALSKCFAIRKCQGDHNALLEELIHVLFQVITNQIK